MNWIKAETDGFEEFWHVTERSNIDSIRVNGIRQSTTGIYNDGVYCIKKDIFRTKIDTLIYFMEKNNLERDSLVIVEFEHNGIYYINEIRPMFEESGWIVIKEDIPKDLVDKIIEIDDI